MRYLDVYQNIFLFGQRIEIMKEFRYESVYELYMSPGWAYSKEEKKQKDLIYHVNFIIKNYSESQKLRAITAFWKEEENKICLSFYFDGFISDDDLEDAYDIGAGVIANFPNGLLEEEYIRLDYPKPIPTQFLAYKKDEK